MRLTHILVDWLLGPFSMLRKVWPSILALSVLTAAGTLVFHHFHENFDWLDALYASVNTITTIGLYGTDMTRMPDAEKAILIVIIIFSVGVAATALQNIVGTMVQRELWQENVTRWRAKRMEKHAVVIGGGNCALEIAKKLANLGMPHVVVLPEKSLIPPTDFSPAPVIRGELRRHTTLTDAGAERAAQIEIAVDDDALALVVTMSARQINANARIIVNADDEELTNHFKIAGANVVICSSRVIGRAMAVAAVTDHVSGMVFSELAGLQKEIGVFTVAEGSPASGKSIGESEVHLHAWILGVVRAGTFHWEVGRESLLHAGDVIVVLGDVKSFESLRKLVVETE
jgi:voltage-gated potassium channel